MSQPVFDEEAARKIEAICEIGDAVRRRRLVREALGVSEGDRGLDVGCGPGFYCAELVREVGPSCAVTGVDASRAMLALATRRTAGHSNVELREADATGLPVPDASFDAALSVQVLEYVADVGKGLTELHRVLRPGGRLLVWDIDWATVSIHSEDAERTARVLEAWDEHLAHRSLPRTLRKLLQDARLR
jgi:arsenite methyltransferase